MYRFRGKPTLCLVAALLYFHAGAAAGASGIDAAVKQYYAGYPDKAIAMLKPIARAGDLNAQILLGNIVYALSSSAQLDTAEDPLEWYRMAAAQGSAEASYALGAIYHNDWLQGRREEDAKLAEFFFQQALDRGYARAEGPLIKLGARKHANRQSKSLEYTNSSFRSKRESLPAPEASSKPATLEDRLANFEPSGDPAADAMRIEALLRQLGDGLAGDSVTAGNWPDEATLTRLLTGLGANNGLVADVVRLLGQVKSASEHSLQPGAN